jgi:hypothetical protein
MQLAHRSLEGRLARIANRFHRRASNVLADSNASLSHARSRPVDFRHSVRVAIDINKLVKLCYDWEG